MIYFHPSSANVWEDINTNFIGFIASPRCVNYRIINSIKFWCGDNGSFTNVFEEDKFFCFLDRMLPYKEKCKFIACPDTLCDPVDTMKKWELYAERIKNLGYPVAFVCQDGQENLPFPSNYDALFIGGSTEWKLGGGALQCIREAKKNNKFVHVGRVNSLKRVKHFMLEGVDSVDGTHVCFEPDKAIERIKKWMRFQPLWKGE